MERKRIRTFENKQTNKNQIFITIMFNQREKSYFFEFLKLPPNRTRSLAHCIFYIFQRLCGKASLFKIISLYFPDLCSGSSHFPHSSILARITLSGISSMLGRMRWVLTNEMRNENRQEQNSASLVRVFFLTKAYPRPFWRL